MRCSLLRTLVHYFLHCTLVITQDFGVHCYAFFSHIFNSSLSFLDFYLSLLSP
ncbi:hypothetical protein BDU57DRAFT_522505 [Ampelomyces quisqualis]|uniref:Uncharacterized protein n=1 Tax=Ampelomyces quisqualis TaxID=50730 RepID=A0A6A5QCT0_AMPQU|nr:hypothetical protein BDU57DRAFT_522505 [Ampelomyces quisqualis]